MGLNNKPTESPSSGQTDVEKTVDSLIDLIGNLDEKQALAAIRRLLAAEVDPFIILKACQEGVRLVGRRYEDRRYFISGLIMGGEILREAVELIQPTLERQDISITPGLIVLGTVAGDIHDIGKNIVEQLLSSQGFQIIDLGVDVSPEVFVDAIRRYQPRIVGLSCLLSTAFDSLKDTIRVIRHADIPSPPRIIVGGGVIEPSVTTFVGADFGTSDAMEGVLWCQQEIEREATD